MRILLALLCLLVVASIAVPEEPVDEVARLVDDYVGRSPETWDDLGEDLGPLREAARRDPARVIRFLVDRLAVDRTVPGLLDESQIHNVCGNALTLLERLTEERICGLGRDWIGFSTHDHRGARPSPEKIQGPWLAWLAVRKDVPVERWFWGLSYDELLRVRPLLRTAETAWTDEDLAPVRALGRRAYPFLLDKLGDDEYAGVDVRVCDRANALLRRLTGKDLGEIARHELMRIDPQHPDRKHRLAIARNRASMALLARRWTAVLLAR